MFVLRHYIPLDRCHEKILRKDSVISRELKIFASVVRESVSLGVLCTWPVCDRESKSCEELCPSGLSEIEMFS